MKFTFTCACFCLFYLLIACSATMAQTNIGGQVFDGSSRKQLQGASVKLCDGRDAGTIVKQVASDAGGKYLFQDVKRGNYFIITSYVGYLADSVRIDITNNLNTRYDLNVSLFQQSSTLKTIGVTARRPVIKFDKNKIVFDVSQSVLASGNSLWDMLAKAPGVETEGNSVSILGTSGATVLINGRTTFLTGDQLVTYLKSIIGDQVAQIEIIQHPGSKYDMGQGTGVINVILKKNQAAGFSGTAVLTYGRGKYDKFIPSVNLNYRIAGLNIYGNYAFNHNKDYLDQPSYVNYLSQSAPLRFNQDQYFTIRTASHNFTAGADYQINKNNSVGLFFNGTVLRRNSDYDNLTTIMSQANVDSMIKTSSTIRYPNELQLYNLYYSTKPDSVSTAVFNIDYGHYTSNNSQNYQFQYFRPDLSQSRPAESFSNTVPGKIGIRAFSADYTRNLSKSVNLEAGVKLSETKVDNNIQYSQLLTGTSTLLNNESFNYDEKISAAYVTADKTFVKGDYFKLGVRAEYTDAQGNTSRVKDLVDRQYLRLFPSVLYTHDFNSKHSVNLSYSTSFERPGYAYLSPFTIQRDPNSYSAGNPFLRPSYTNSFELDYVISQKYTIALEYDDIHDRIEQWVQQDYSTKVLANIIYNIEHCYYYRVYFLVPVSVSKWWQSNNTLNNYIIQYKTAYLNGTYDVSKPVFYLSSINSFTFSPSVTMDLTGYYRTPSLNGLYHVGTRKFVDIGIKKLLGRNKGSVSLILTDVFHTNKWKWDIDYLNQNSGYSTATDSRILRLSFSYKFGRTA